MGATWFVASPCISWPNYYSSFSAVASGGAFILTPDLFQPPVQFSAGWHTQSGFLGFVARFSCAGVIAELWLEIIAPDGVNQCDWQVSVQAIWPQGVTPKFRLGARLSTGWVALPASPWTVTWEAPTAEGWMASGSVLLTRI